MHPPCLQCPHPVFNATTPSSMSQPCLQCPHPTPSLLLLLLNYFSVFLKAESTSGSATESCLRTCYRESCLRDCYQEFCSRASYQGCSDSLKCHILSLCIHGVVIIFCNCYVKKHQVEKLLEDPLIFLRYPKDTALLSEIDQDLQEMVIQERKKPVLNNNWLLM